MICVYKKALFITNAFEVHIIYKHSILKMYIYYIYILYIHMYVQPYQEASGGTPSPVHFLHKSSH